MPRLAGPHPAHALRLTADRKAAGPETAAAGSAGSPSTRALTTVGCRLAGVDVDIERSVILRGRSGLDTPAGTEPETVTRTMRTSARPAAMGYAAAEPTGSPASRTIRRRSRVGSAHLGSVAVTRPAPASGRAPGTADTALGSTARPTPEKPSPPAEPPTPRGPAEPSTPARRAPSGPSAAGAEPPSAGAPKATAPRGPTEPSATTPRGPAELTEPIEPAAAPPEPTPAASSKPSPPSPPSGPPGPPRARTEPPSAGAPRTTAPRVSATTARTPPGTEPATGPSSSDAGANVPSPRPPRSTPASSMANEPDISSTRGGGPTCSGAPRSATNPSALSRRPKWTDASTDPHRVRTGVVPARRPARGRSPPRSSAGR